MKDTKIITNELYKTVEQNLSNKKVTKQLLLDISKYFDRNSEIIYDIGISGKLLFLESDKNVIYRSCDLTPNVIKNVLKKSSYIKSSWKILNEPLNTASVLMARYFTISKQDDLLKTFLTYYSFYFYSSLHHKYLKFEPQENVMEYTINNLSNKYKIKQLGSLFAAIQNTVMTSHDNYKKQLINGEDGDYALYISSIKSRLNDFVKNITNEYMNNKKNERFLNFDNDDYSEENFHIADNTSYAVRRLCDASTIKLMTYGVNIEIANLAAQMCQVSQNEIRNVITQLTNEDSKDISMLCELILQLYLFDPHNNIRDIKSSSFIIKSAEIYTKSNTNDKSILKIKEILNKWLTKYSTKYRQTNRPATLSNFRKAIFLYFVMHIKQSNI